MKILFNNKKIIIVIFLVIMIIIASFSYAFFAERESELINTNSGIEGLVKEKLIFEHGDSINIAATLENFENGDGSLKDETISTVTLEPGTETGSASAFYKVSYEVKVNDFKYSTSSKESELLLKVLDPSGKEITRLNDLVHKTITDAHTGEVLTGFDITEFTGIIELNDFYGIAANNAAKVIQEWVISVTFVNLNTSQNINFNKSFSSDLIFEKTNINDIDVFPDFAANIVEDNGGFTSIYSKVQPDFSKSATTNEGMYLSYDDYGRTLYFRGAVDNNWVYFANYYWKIVRINGNGSIKIIYMGESVPSESSKVYYSSNNIGNSQYNYSSYIITEHTGYMFTLNQNKGLSTSSTIKNLLETWYSNNLLPYSDYISDNLFCNDRTLISGQGYGNTTNTFAAYNRIFINDNPLLLCSDKIDSFTSDDITFGNSSLTYPIALLSADEVIMAGIVNDNSNSNNFLSGNSFWTMTPSRSYSSKFYTMNVDSNGKLLESAVYWTQSGVRPVINIKGDALFTGTGTWDDPYTM